MLISVIVPVYNSAKTIKRLVKCLAAQTDEEYEVIFVNDGSTDETAEILKEFCADKKNFKIVTTKNGGAGAARNAGIDKASGDYICFADSDDLVSPNYVKQLRKIATESGADVVCTKYARNQKTDYEHIVNKSEIVAGAAAVDALLQMKIDNGPVAKLFSRKLVGNIRMPNVMVAEDLYFNYEVLEKAKKVALNDSVLYSYIETTGSLSTKRFSPERMGSLEIVQKIDAKEKSFYSEARVFMEAYFICELIVLAKAEKEYPDEYKKVCDILTKERKNILSDARATVRQKLIARLLKFGPKMTVRVMTAKSSIRRKK